MLGICIVLREKKEGNVPSGISIAGYLIKSMDYVWQYVLLALYYLRFSHMCNEARIFPPKLI